MTFEDLCDVESATAKLATQRPRWEPGTQSGYYCWSYGHVLGAIVRRVTGLRLREYIATHLAGARRADF